MKFTELESKAILRHVSNEIEAWRTHQALERTLQDCGIEPLVVRHIDYTNTKLVTRIGKKLSKHGNPFLAVTFVIIAERFKKQLQAANESRIRFLKLTKMHSVILPDSHPALNSTLSCKY